METNKLLTKKKVKNRLLFLTLTIALTLMVCGAVSAADTPTANFTANTTSGNSPLTVQFTDTSTGNPTSWSWDFENDGTVDSTERNPIHTYNVAGTYDVWLNVSNIAGSNDELKSNFITANCDLQMGGVPNPLGGSVFCNEPNTIRILNVKNNVGNSPETEIQVTASDGWSGRVTVPALNQGQSTTISIVDPTIRTTQGGSVTYTAIIDPDGLIPETNEGNNVKTANRNILYNGYKGADYWAGKENITTYLTYDLRGDIVYSLGNSTYMSGSFGTGGWTNYTVGWTSSDINIPAGANIVEARLYVPYCWDNSNEASLVTILFNGVLVPLEHWELDQSNFGSYLDHWYGLMTYNVTDLFIPYVENNATLFRINNQAKFSPAGLTLMVVYEDPSATRKQIFINEGCDLLGASESDYATSEAEATSYLPFTGMIIDMAHANSALLTSFVPWGAGETANIGEGNLLVNGVQVGHNVWSYGQEVTGGSSNSQVAIDSRNILAYLNSSGLGNIIGIQSTASASPCMVASQTFLVVEYNDEIPVANFTANITEGSAPLEVKFTDTSTGAPTSWAWDFDNDGNTDSTQQNPTWTYNDLGTYTVKLTVSNPAGSDTEEKTDYITIRAPDLIIVDIRANKGIGDSLFANEPNVISVTVKNNGTVPTGVSNLEVNVNGTLYNLEVPALAPGENTTVNITDPVNRTGGDSVPVSANTDPLNNIPETNETNNIMNTSFVVYNNGYKGKRYTNGDDLETEQIFDGHYDVIYSTGNTAYNGANWSEKTYSWTSSDLVIPASATVVSARLYQSYTYNQMGADPAWIMTFNSNLVNAIATYSDIKGFGAFNFPYGLYVYDVTSLFNTAGNTITITPEAGNNYGIYGAYLIVVYQDPDTSEKKIYINDGFDMLCSRETYSVNDTEATAIAPFTDVSTEKMGNAQAIAILASASDSGKSKFFFNGQEYTGFWNDYLSESQTGFSVYDVTNAVINGLNVASLQSYDSTPGITSSYGDNIYVMGTILVTTRDTIPPEVIANLAEGLYNTTQTVSLTATDNLDPNPQIYYTTNGTNPTTNSNQYTEPLNITSTTTLKFIAVDNAGNWSPLQTLNYIIDTTLPPTTASLNSGSYSTDQTVTLTATDDQDNNPEIYYTINGGNWEHQPQTVTLNFNTEGLVNLKFYAVDAAGNHGLIQERNYTIDKTQPVANASLANGTYNTPQSVTLTATDNLDPNPQIYYTTNGTNPTTNSNHYTEPLNITSTTTLKFIAVDSAGNLSPVYTRVYTIPRTDVYVNSSVSNSNPQVGDIITMTFKVGNNGPENATGVVFTYVIPENFEYVGMNADSLPNPTYNPLTRTVTWNLGDLPVSDPKLNLFLRVLSAGSSTSSPNILATTYDYLTSNNAPSLTFNIRTAGSTVINPATSTSVNAAENTSLSTVPMQETGTPFTGLIVGVLSVLGGLGISRKGRKKKLPILLIVGVVLVLAICGTASADPYVGGDPPVTVQNGTVSGGLYEDTYYGFNNSVTPTDVNYNFKSLPNNAQVVNATLYTAVYCGNMQTNYPTDVNITFNGQQIASEHLSSSYSYPQGGAEDWGSLKINDHCNRVTSDYFMWYDVTSLVQQNNIAHVVSDPDCFDGRIKIITLIVAYNDGDSDQIIYWVNQGHDADNYYMETNLGENYVGQTTFESKLPTIATLKNATLKVIHLSSADGKYTFNGNNKGNSKPQGSYSGSDTWNVASDFINYGTNTLTYDRNGQYYKIALALLSVKYSNEDSRADLFIKDITVPEVAVANQTYTVKTTINNGGVNSANSFQVKLYDNNKEVGSQIVNSLAPSSSTLLNFSWKPTTIGSHSLRIFIDPPNQVDETNETNNQINKILEVDLAKPDLIPEKLVVPLDLTINQVYQLNATIANKGYKNSNSFVVKLYDNDQEIGSQTINGLNIGQTIKILFNWKPTTYGSHYLKIVTDPDKLMNEYNEINNEFKKFVLMKENGVVSVFITSDKPQTNILNIAALNIISNIQGLSIQLRNGLQIEAMTEDELYEYLRTCDVFIGDWVMTNAEGKLTTVLNQHPEVANKGVFLILEPPASVKPNSIALMKYSAINGVKLLENFTTEQLLLYYQNTMRGTDYNSTVEYMKSVNFPEVFNKAVLYKNLNDKANMENQILWALNLLGLHTIYQEPTFSSGKQELGIYRYRWYTLEEYMAAYFKNDREGCVGLIESTMYIDAQQLQPYYAIIEALESRGLNVIPVMAYGGTEEQLKIMLSAFTNATNATSFIRNPSDYLTRIDAIVAMPAYGLGGADFTLTTQFFDALGVPVIRAIHSDYVSNEAWYLSTSGLPDISGDKWWHVTILEAQGEIEPIFVGGIKSVINPLTGASIIDYVPQEENINSMADKILGWVQLKYMANALKQVAIIYYNYPPGKNNIGASYLDPVQSILNLLNALKSQGYTVENIPVDDEALLKLMLTQGINVANWAPGEVEKLANNPNVVLYSVDDYMTWFSQLDQMAQLYVTQGPVAYIGELVKKAVQLGYTSDASYITDLNTKIDTWLEQIMTLLPENKIAPATPLLNNLVTSLKKYAVSQSISDYNNYISYKTQFFALGVEGMSGWGEAPGDIMVVERNGKKYFVLPGVKFGNIFIGPEPQRGWEGDPDQLYHNTAVPPHHQYLAFFAWLQQQGTDAMVYMGRHATHEWLPGKEVILAPTDFPNIVTGNVPQIYFYIADGLAEGIQAKRRGNAVIIDHLTPPMTYTSLYGYLGQLATLADDYDMVNSTQKTEIINQIKTLIKENDVETGMGVKTDQMSNTELIAAVNSYISDIQNMLYPYGLYVIGEKWNENQTALMVTSMLSVAFQLPESTNTTTLQNEISHIVMGKTFDSLSAWEKDVIQGACIEIVKELIYNDVDTIASKLTSNPSTALKLTLQKAKNYIILLNESVDNEIESFLTALNGGYITPGPGNDPISNPDVLPTGRNFYQDQAAEIPTIESYEYGKTLALLLLSSIDENTKKVAIGIWCVETARDDGSLVSMVLYLLGMKPVWSDSPSAGVNGQKLKEMPEYIELEDLVRPEGWSKKRIDAVVITSGLFRDLYSRQAGLLDKAFRIALARSYYTILADASLSTYGNKVKTALDKIMDGIGYYGVGSESLNDNYVAQNWINDFIYYLGLNMTSEEAGEMAISRIFAPPEGDYGAGISKALEMSWTWNSTNDLAEYYLQRMGHIYTQNNWGKSNPAVFARALTNIGVMYTSRNTNLYDTLDNDDYVDYWGGLYNTLNYVNGRTVNWNVIRYPDRSNPQLLSIQQTISRDLTSRYLNPDYNEGMGQGGYSEARYLSKALNNFWKFSAIAPELTTSSQWDQWAREYYGTGNSIGFGQWMTANNPFAAQQMLAKFLDAERMGMWRGSVTSPVILDQMIKDLYQNLKDNGVSCCDCVCGNVALMTWAANHMNPDMAAKFKEILSQATHRAEYNPTEQQKQPSSQSVGAIQTGQPDAAGEEATTDTSDERGEGAKSEVGDEAGEKSQKSYEVSKNTPSGSAQSGLPIAAVAGVIVLVILVGLGYFKGNLMGLFGMLKK